ncbi:hypothetical protein D0Z07_7446 [Hyphodiscus hymeniophilus]|uniref:JmjC domain-containing protein n=1 Tax=Hyphodiscus hymeniophilus TaxID=353542 RepID=A0A9P7AUG4_9HELO|nr:hypothetical protein D0Z07_7446 [Hyphodiscus hymeniophilus]
MEEGYDGPQGAAEILMLMKCGTFCRTPELPGGASRSSTISPTPTMSTLAHMNRGNTLHTLVTPPPTPPETGNKSSNTSPSPPPLETRLCDDPTCPDASKIPCNDPTCPYLTQVDNINRQQRILVGDPRSQAQLRWFKEVVDTKPATYYSQLAPIGIHILEQGRAAQTSHDLQKADFLVGDCKRLDKWLQNGSGDKLFVLQDEEWFNTRPSLSASEFFKELRAKGMSKTLLLEVQELGKQIGDPNVNAVQPMPIDEILERWHVKDQSIPPINLLNLMCKDDAYQPWPLAKHCNLLNQAAASCASIAQSAFYATAGKESTEVMTKLIDLEACMHFMIFGQAGAISTWHMDAIGPYTYITLEPNEEGRQPDEVLKLWAYVRTDHLSEPERAEIKLQFRQDHESFKPDPKHIRILALVAGDTLIMPPGTIHAPITITDCLFRGGMVMQKKEMWRSIREWRFCSDNDQCTNENQPRQARSMLDYFRREVHANPAACGYKGDSGRTVEDFENDWRQLSGASMVCSCKAGCKTRKCGCQINSQRCGSHCHGGIVKCENPYGCEVQTQVEVLAS